MRAALRCRSYLAVRPAAGFAGPRGGGNIGQIRKFDRLKPGPRGLNADKVLPQSGHSARTSAPFAACGGDRQNPGRCDPRGVVQLRYVM